MPARRKRTRVHAVSRAAGNVRSTPAARRRAPRNVRRTPPRPRVPLRARWQVLRERSKAFYVRSRPLMVTCLRVGLAVAIAGGSVGVVHLLEQHVRSSPAFATQVIEIEGAERLSRAEILDAAGLKLGRNVLEVSPEEAEAALGAHPWIASARVQRRLPGTYRLEVSERRAVALLALGENYLVAADGSVFKALSVDDEADLPVITGVDRQKLTSDKAYRTSVLMAAVSLLHEYRAAGLWAREPIAEIHVEPGQRLSLYVGDDATYARLGRQPFREKLQRLRSVFDRLQRREARPAYVYLDNVRRPDRVTVRLR